MAQLTSDKFQRANENPLSGGGNWSTVSGEQPCEVLGDACVGTSTAFRNVGFYSGISWPNDQYSEITVGALVTSSWFGALVRCSSSVDTYYLAKAVNNGNATVAVLLQLMNAGSISLLGSITPPLTMAIGDVVKEQAQGTTISVWYNGTNEVSVTDSTIASGSAGLMAKPVSTPSDTQISEWDGGSLYLSAPVIPSSRDQGHIYDQVLYFGTLAGWGGRTGVLTPDTTQGDTPFPTIHSGEVASARAHIDDFTFTPVNGQRCAFYMLRTSAGDKVALEIQPK